jgi:hypothetical protein
MTSGAVTLLGTAESARPSARAPGVVEFLLVGGITLLLWPLAWFFRSVVGLDSAELGVGFLAFHGAYLINDPHFSVTYLLFYKDVRERAFGKHFSPLQRARYLVAGFLAPVVLALWAGLSLATRSAHSMGLLIQLMFFLVGWHYVKQGFGVLTVLSSRRGFRFSAIERKVLLAHCFAGWAYAWASPADPGITVEEKGVVYASLPRPPALELVTGVVFAASTLALIFVLAQRWRRERRLPPLAPLSGLLITVWLWTVYSSVDPLMIYVIPALHSVQYLYFVWLLKRNEAKEQEGPPAFGRPVGVRLALLAAGALGLGWLLFHGAPEFLDSAFSAPGSSDPTLYGALGATPYFAALFAFVNIHHYFMDAVIWRRENPETRYLQR